MDPAVQARRLVDGYQVSQAIHVAVVLGLPDRVAGGPRSADELASATGSHPRSLYRLMRALATVGVFHELPGQRFQATELSDALRSDAPAPISGWAAFAGRPPTWRAWGSLLHSVRTGESAFEHVHGCDMWAYWSGHPEEGVAFDAAMTSTAGVVSSAVLDAYDFGRFREIVDVGGGRGGFLASILTRWPEVRGVVLDLPHVVAGAGELLAGQGVAERCRIAPGSFFDEVPAGADAYLLKSVMHNWPDEKAVEILRVCRAAMDGHATMLLVERVIRGPNEDPDSAFVDINMLVGPGGQERTQLEYADLLDAAGLRLVRVVPSSSVMSVIESVPA
jgi:hypothetical protein